jgi:hypothetical protein
MISENGFHYVIDNFVEQVTKEITETVAHATCMYMYVISVFFKNKKFEFFLENSISG